MLRVLDCIVTISFGVSCTVVVLTGFVIYGCVCMCGFCNVCVCVYTCIYCVFVLLHLCIFLFGTCVRTTVTE
jgi:hypothetical protein